MNGLFSALYLSLCLLVATRIGGLVSHHRNAGHGTATGLAWIVLLFSVFYGVFSILGFVNLFTGLPVVRSVYGCAVVFSGWLITEAVSRRHSNSYNRVILKQNRLAILRNMFLSGSGIVKGLTILTVAGFGVLGIMVAAGFPRGYEAQGYHLPIAVNIFQTGSLNVWTVWNTPFLHAFPANASIFYGFLLTFLSEHLVATTGLLFLLLLGIAEYAISQEITADENASILAALGIVTSPLITLPALDAVADVGGAAFFAISIYFTLSANARPFYRSTLGGLAAGIAFGFKSLHLVGIAYLLLVWLLQVHRLTICERSRSTRIFKMAKGIAPFSFAFLSMSGFWLVRNYVELHNPLYPVHLSFFNLLGWPKAEDFASISLEDQQFYWVRSSFEWLAYPWVEGLRDGKRFNPLGAFVAASLPAALLIAIHSVIKCSTPRRWLIAVLLVGGTCTLTAWFILNNRQPRYFIGALVFWTPLVAWMASQLSLAPRRLFELIISLCIVLALWMTFSRELITFGARIIYGHGVERWQFYGYPPVVDQLPAGSIVVNLGHRTRNYELQGKAQQNRIIVYSEAHSALKTETSVADGPAETASLSADAMAGAGATHLFVEGNPKFVLDDCVGLMELGKLDKDLVGNPLSNPLRLYKINYCQE
jgi:hypothetical protein